MRKLRRFEYSALIADMYAEMYRLTKKARPSEAQAKAGNSSETVRTSECCNELTYSCHRNEVGIFAS
jgi:hypothetical protein